MVISAFCGDLELIYPRSDACLACTQKLASLVFMLYRNRGMPDRPTDFSVEANPWLTLTQTPAS